jgi:hypothetical protein
MSDTAANVATTAEVLVPKEASSASEEFLHL